MTLARPPSLIRQYIMGLRLRLDAPFPSQLRDRALRFLRLVRVK